MNSISPVRPSPIAGSWYPGTPASLSAAVKEFIESSIVPPLPGKVIGLVSPHAGYIYSGPTAGYAYRTVVGQKFDTVVVLSPLHDYRPEPFLTSAHGSYATPLGEITIDRTLLLALQNELAQEGRFEVTPVAYDREHSLEIQLPFLQFALAAPFSLLPIMVREHRPENLKYFASILSKVLKRKNVLLVASTDLSHFYTETIANELDSFMLEQIHRFSPEGVLKAEEEGTGSACGSGAVAVALWTAKSLGGKSVTILNHSTSAWATCDTSQVVGYGAAVICA